MASFFNTESPVTENDIRLFEQRVQIILPLEYKRHLLLHNGGQCNPNTFDFLEKKKQTSSCIDWFLALYNGEFDNLETYINDYKIYEKRLPAHIIPIANDPGGNLICISYGEDYGYVYFWDHENEGIEKPDENIIIISNSFDEFINSLY